MRRNAQRKWGVLASAAVALIMRTAALAVAGEPGEQQLDLEALLQMKVTSVSRKPESWFDVPSALSILTEDDVRRSGALTIPDALRYAPGVHVARYIGNSY